MTDLATLKSNYNLLDVISNMKKCGSLYWQGPCPFCGGNDRFQIKETNKGQLWVCRHCSPDGQNGKKYQDVIEFVARQSGMDLHASSPTERFKAMNEITRLMGGNLTSEPHVPHPAPLPTAILAPANTWQNNAYQAMRKCELALWSPAGTHALAWLMGPERRLTESMLKTWNIGYSIGFQQGDIYIPRGVLIPCYEYGDLWYLKIRLVPGDKFKCVGCKKESTQPGQCECGKTNKYKGVTGNKPALFGATTMCGCNLAIVCEGEFDAMHLWSSINRLPNPFCNRTAIITTGASSHYFDYATWGLPLTQYCNNRFICIYDEDEAGENAYKHMRKISSRVIRAHLPKVNKPIKDITDFVKAGGNLPAWLTYQIAHLTQEGS